MRSLLMLLCLCGLFLCGCFSKSRPYVYQLPETPKMLTEALALEKARETMAKAGFNLERWQVMQGDRVDRAPDGTPDSYIERFGQTNWGRFHFTNGKRNRCVQVRLDGDRLTCEVVQLL